MDQALVMPPYENYKKVENSCFIKIPMDWTLSRVAHVGHVIDPQPDHRAPAIATTGGFPYVGIRDVNPDGTLNFDTARQVKESAVVKQEKSFSIDEKDIIFGKVGTLGLPKHIKPHGRMALSATLVLIKSKPNVDRDFLRYALDADTIYRQIDLSAVGATRPALGIQQIRKLNIPLPPPETQRRIAEFLNKKTREIDEAIAKKKRLVELLKEQKSILINHVVTKGLNPDVPMRDSGVEWIGEVPNHWNLRKVKHIFRLVLDPAEKNNNHELLSVYTDIGVRPRKDLEERGNKASTTDGYWLVKKGDIIVNKLLAWMGAIGLSNYDGVTSPAYDILRPIVPLDGNYFHNMFRMKSCSQELKKNSRGIMDMRLRLYFDKFGQVIVPFPPEQEQFAISRRLSDIDAKFSEVVSHIEKEIECLDELKRVQISQVVTGNIKI